MAAKDTKLVRSEWVHLRCTEEEKEQIIEYAAAQHMNTSTLLRVLLAEQGVFDAPKTKETK